MLLFTTLLLAVLQGTNSQLGPPLQLNPIQQGQESSLNTVTSRFNDFDIDLLQTFDNKRNYFISPASIKSTLGMVLEGARGRCAEEIARVLGLPINPANSRDRLQSLIYDLNAKSTTTLLEVANGAFISNAFQIVPEFERNLRQFYKANVRSLDFSNPDFASKIINNWVSDATRGKITEIVNPSNFNSDATLVITNALYFKGKWKHEFDGTTSIKCFYSRHNHCVRTMMMQTDGKFRYLNDLDSQFVELPYGDGQYAMLVALPSEKNSVRSLARDLQHKTSAFAYIVDRLESTEVSIHLPKFEIDYTADIVSDLQNLGIEEVFTDSANLTGIIPRGQIKIDNIVHKAKVEVNEKGTVAAGATGIIAVPLIGSSAPRFEANRPFLFFIYQVASKNIIFEGRLNEPADAYNEIFQGPQTSRPLPAQTSRPLPPSSSAQNTQSQQAPVGLSADSASGSKQSAHSESLFYQREPVSRPGEYYSSGQPSEYNNNNRNYNQRGI